MAESLTALGCHWVLRHVYREYNKVADKLAGDCIQDPATAGHPHFGLCNDSTAHIALACKLSLCGQSCRVPLWIILRNWLEQ